MKRTSEESRSTDIEMEKWAENIKTVQNERIKLAIIAANNLYAGFGPGTVNIFRDMLGLPDAKWEEKGEGKEQQQEQELGPERDELKSAIQHAIDSLSP